ncbi:MAG: HNH endonuclease [Micrococcaceae bacterium]|nr:HNH endonuclease [Micrococcaceae bacterium]
MHYYRWHRYGDVNYIGRVVYGPPEARFLTKVDKSKGGCWLWIGYLNRSGYGTFGVNGKAMLAHRWSYEHYIGPIPDGLDIDHLCRVRHCVNPAHMEPVTNAENIARSPIHYGARTRCKNGHEFTPENTAVRPDGGRRCLTCKRMWGRKTAARKRARTS